MDQDRILRPPHWHILLNGCRPLARRKLPHCACLCSTGGSPGKGLALLLLSWKVHFLSKIELLMGDRMREFFTLLIDVQQVGKFPLKLKPQWRMYGNHHLFYPVSVGSSLRCFGGASISKTAWTCLLYLRYCMLNSHTFSWMGFLLFKLKWETPVGDER